MMLIFKELKKIVFSITFIIFLVVLIAFPVSQDIMNFKDEIISEPNAGEDYGMKNEEVPEVIMPVALQMLTAEFNENLYAAYPIGFYKTVKLNDEKQEKMAEIIASASNSDISYNEFLELMKQADKLIGGGSQYTEDNLLNLSYVPISYEEALEEYNALKDSDRFTGAYMRLFCDYVGIILSVFPVFLGAAISLKDDRAKMSTLIFARKTSAFNLIFVRWFAIIISVILPTLILAYISNISVWSNYKGFTIDYFAPIKYTFGWLLPSVMISAAVGMFFSELTGTPIAIAIQGIWWFIDLNIGAVNLSNGFKMWQLTPRHNTLGKTQVFADSFNVLMKNRFLFACITLCIVFATAFIYEQKRRGKLDGYEKIRQSIHSFTNHKNKSAV